MSDSPTDEHWARQNDLDQEQAVVDLDQVIADREQARVDRDQEPLNAETEALATGADEGRGGTRSHALRSDEITIRQDRQDAHQAQIDQTQLAQGARQDVIDQQQIELDAPQAPPLDDDDLERAGEEAPGGPSRASRRGTRASRSGAPASDRGPASPSSGKCAAGQGQLTSILCDSAPPGTPPRKCAQLDGVARGQGGGGRSPAPRIRRRTRGPSRCPARASGENRADARPRG